MIDAAIDIQRIKEPDSASPTGNWLVRVTVEGGIMNAAFGGHAAESWARQYAMWLVNRKRFLPAPPEPSQPEDEDAVAELSTSLALPPGGRVAAVSVRPDGRTIDMSVVLDAAPA